MSSFHRLRFLDVSLILWVILSLNALASGCGGEGLVTNVQAQSLDPLPLRAATRARIPSPAIDSMPESHRSAYALADEPAAVIYCPAPRYPAELAAFGFDGVVDLQYVIDTTGRAELDDLLVQRASHPGFIAPARQAIAKCRYRPARKAGQPTRYLVRQRVRYRLKAEP